MNSKNIRKDQKGVVTIVIVILIMLLMSLIVLAMSRNANREQRQALDRQLNNQAFYAAESGINDLLKGLGDPDLPVKDDDCNSDFAGPLVAGSVVEVTCLLYNKEPDTLVYEGVSLNESKVVPLQSADGISTLSVSFEADAVANPDFSGCDSFDSGDLPPRTVNNCDAGVLKVDIVRTDDPTRDNLLEDTFSLFIVPRDANGASSYGYVRGQQGSVVRANCSSDNTPRKCKVNITSLGLGSDQRMYMNMRSIYTPNTVELGSDTGSFKNAQVFVDSTGKANDVLKRIQARIPVHALSNSPHSSFSLNSSTDICKLLQVRPGDTEAGGCTLD